MFFKNHILIFVSAVLMASCSQPAVPPKHADLEKESVLQAISSMMLGESATDDVISVVDSAETAGVIDNLHARLIRAKAYGRTESGFLQARSICEELLQDPHLSPEDEADILEYLCYLCRMRTDDLGEVEYGLRFVQVCESLGDSMRAVPVQADMGSSLVRIGRDEDGLLKINDAISKLDGEKGFFYLDAGIKTRKSLIRTYIDLERYLDVVPVAQEIISRLEDYAAAPEAYADSSPNLPGDHNRPGYVDFYTAQALAFITYAYAAEGMRKEAQEYNAHFEKTRYSKTFGGRKMISSAWPLLGEYDRMLSFYDELQRRWGADTLHADYAIMLENRALAAKSKGRYREALGYMQRYSSLADKLNDSQNKAMIQDYVAKYRYQEQKMALERERVAVRRSRSIALGASAGALVCLILLGIILQYVILVRRKNKALVSQISENVILQREKVDASALNGNPELSSLSDAQLFEYLRYKIVTNNLYADSRLDRQFLMDRYHLSKERIGSAFSHGSPYQSLAAFLNVVRLKKAAKMLSSSPEMSISDVASACGFSSGSLFARNFKQYFALTPTEFRQNPSSFKDMVK